MARVQVNYDSIPTKASQIKGYGIEINSAISSAYKSIDGMRSSWYGKRYNTIVKEFNAMVGPINTLLGLVVGDIPYILETIANNYAQADKGAKVASGGKESPTKISNISLSSSTGLRFESTAVQQVQQSVSRNFSTAKDKVNAIATTCSSIEWQSSAADALKSRLRQLNNDISSAFGDINNEFTKLINQAMQDMKTTENKNFV